MSERPVETPLGIPTGFGPSGRVGGAASAPVARLRLTFSKEGALRYIGHLDLVRMWERAFRRARLPLAYTLGFTPHPRLTFAAPLSLGATSNGELLDVYLRETMSAEELVERIAPQLPEGCGVRAATALPVEGPPLTALTRWAAYAVSVSGAGDQTSEKPTAGGAPGSRWSRGDRAADAATIEPEGDDVPRRPPDDRLPAPEPAPPLPTRSEVAGRIETFMAAVSVPFERQRDGKRLDLRPFVLSLGMPDSADSTPPDGRLALEMTVRLDASGSGRPDDIAAALGLRARSVHRRRIGLEGEPAEHLPG